MKKPCEICGDVGFEAIIRICSKCKNTHEHVYCMRVKYDGNPDAWVCEECETPTPKFLLKLVQTEQTDITGTRASIKKPPQNTKTKYLTPTEAMGLEAGFVRNNYSSTRKPSSSSRPTMNMSSPRKESTSSMPMPQNCITQPNPEMGCPGFTKPLNSTTLRSSPTFQNMLSPRRESITSVPMPQNCITQTNLEMGPPGFTKPLNSSTLRSSSSVQNLSTSKEKEKPLVQVQNALIKSPVKTGFVGRETGVSSFTVVKEKIKDSSRYLQWETEPPLPPRKIQKSNIHAGPSSQRLPLAAGSPGVHTNPQPRNVDSGERESAEAARQLEKHLSNHHVTSPTMNVGSGEMASAEPSTKLDKHLLNHASASPTSNVGSGGMESTMKLDICLPNHPSASATWKGCFEIPSSIVPCELIGGIQAHPPCKVHSRAYTLSKQMPELLKFEPHFRHSQWSNLFEDDAPCELDIGLYFLPSMRNDPSYARLVDHLDQDDILIKAHMHGVELLIFSSKHLQAKSQRLNHKHFLWGIFCSLEDDSVPLTSAYEEDMVVDMIGGVEVLGRADVVVSKSTEAHLDPSEGNTDPGFSSLVEVKRERTPPTVTSEEMEKDFRRSLQERFDRMIQTARGLTKLEVKIEGEN